MVGVGVGGVSAGEVELAVRMVLVFSTSRWAAGALRTRVDSEGVPAGSAVPVAARLTVLLEMDSFFF